MFRLGGATISWKWKHQLIVALSSTEAEYVALCFAAQETIWLRHLLLSIGFEQVSPMILQEENQGTIALSKNPNNHPHLKHIDIKYHYIREIVEKKQAELVYCPTEKMIANILTERLPKSRFQCLRSLIGVELTDILSKLIFDSIACFSCSCLSSWCNIPQVRVLRIPP